MIDALTVVIVAYGRDDLLESALESVAGLSTVVVDNSTSDSCRAVSAAADATYLRPGRNLGFAGGVNFALTSEHVCGDILLLNPDARVDIDAARRLYEALHTSGRRIACVSPRLVHPGGQKEQRVVWPFPRPGRQALIALGLGRLNRRADFLVGAVLMLRADAVAEVGPFDERFFLYCEESDWQRRAADRGWERLFVPGVTAEHVGGATSSESDLQQAYFHAANEIYIRKRFGARGWWMYRVASVLGAAVRSLVLPGQRRVEARHRLSIYRMGPVKVRDALLARKSSA